MQSVNFKWRLLFNKGGNGLFLKRYNNLFVSKRTSCRYCYYPLLRFKRIEPMWVPGKWKKKKEEKKKEKPALSLRCQTCWRCQSVGSPTVLHNAPCHLPSSSQKLAWPFLECAHIVAPLFEATLNREPIVWWPGRNSGRLLLDPSSSYHNVANMV